jgi:hypothetical protein
VEADVCLLGQSACQDESIAVAACIIPDSLGDIIETMELAEKISGHEWQG